MSEIFPMPENSIEGYHFVIKIPVQFRDVDGMGHANNVAYFAFLETARLEYTTQVMNLHDRASEMKTMPFILASQGINYRAPAYFRESLLVGVRTIYVKRSSFGFEFVMREESSGRLIADGNGTHVMYDYQNERAMPMPDDWLARLETYEGRKLRE